MVFLFDSSDKKTERERLFDFEGADTKPRLRTHEEILATYRKAGVSTSMQPYLYQCLIF